MCRRHAPTRRAGDHKCSRRGRAGARCAGRERVGPPGRASRLTPSVREPDDRGPGAPGVRPPEAAGRVPEGDVMPLIPPRLNGAVAVATDVLRHLPFGPRLVTSAFVSLLANATPPRPRPFTLAGDYTSWISLTDRSFSGRHLPVAAEGTAAADRGRGARAVPAAPRPGDAVGRHQRAVPALRPVVHRQLPADRPHRLAEEHLHPGDRLLPDLRTLGAEDPAAAVDGGRPAEVPADRRPGVPAVPVRAHARAARMRSSRSSRASTTRTGCSTSCWRGRPTGRRTSSSPSGLEHGNSTVGSTALDVLFLREHNRIAGAAGQGVRTRAREPRLGPPDDASRTWTSGSSRPRG